MNRIDVNADNCLATMYPEVAKQWHPFRNGSLSAYDVRAGSHIKTWWVCDKGHEWQATLAHRTRAGTGCPYCSGRYPVKGENDLETLYPSISKEWSQEKNGGLKPDSYTAFSNRKVWWICNKGHEWQATIAHRTKLGTGCPYCSGRYPVKGENDLETLYPDIAKEWNQGKNGDLKPDGCTAFSNRKVWWKCDEGHEWQTKVYHRTGRGTGCPYCSGNFVIPGKTDLQTLFPEIAEELDNNKNENISPYELCAKSGKKVWWVCDKGHSWKASVISRTNLKARCPFCAGQRPVSGENDLETLRPDLAVEWHPTKNRSLKPSECMISSGRKVWWICKTGHEWASVISTRTGKDNCGCPYCYGRYAISGYNDLETVNPVLALEWHPFKNRDIKASQVLPNSNKKVWWQCPTCGYEWRTSIAGRAARGTGCPHCAGRVK